MYPGSRWQVFWSRLLRRIWFRAAAFTVAAVVFALVAGLLSGLLPAAATVDVGQGSVDAILQILASSMLAVTTFSLTAMVSAYASATTNATPRATQLLVDDPTSQNALSTFVGSFAFAIVGVVALSTGYYGPQGRTVLFLGTLVVIAIIVTTLLRWIGHLTTFGRMADVINRVEDAAVRTARTFVTQPNLGGVPAVPVPEGAQPVWTDHVGYVTHVDVGALDRLAQAHDLRVHVIAAPGSIPDADTPLARVEGELDDDLAEAVREAFQVDRHRTFEQDPRLGLIALSEIASRALSPAVNDPGTAIEVLGSLHRVFRILLEPVEPEPPAFTHVHLPRPGISDFVQDAFRPIARDGAGLVEVSVRLQKTLAALAAAATPGDRGILRTAAVQAAERAAVALSESDRLA